MRRALHLLLALTVLWCGLHVMEPAEALAGPFHADHGTKRADAAGDQDEPDHAPARHACHHHCPVAPDLRGASEAAPLAPAAPILSVANPAALASLAHAPPLQPPSA